MGAAEFCYKRPVYKAPVEDYLPPPKRARVEEAESEAGKKICIIKLNGSGSGCGFFFSYKRNNRLLIRYIKS
jgi:hypothetical protein